MVRGAAEIRPKGIAGLWQGLRPTEGWSGFNVRPGGWMITGRASAALWALVLSPLPTFVRGRLT